MSPYPQILISLGKLRNVRAGQALTALHGRPLQIEKCYIPPPPCKTDSSDRDIGSHPPAAQMRSIRWPGLSARYCISVDNTAGVSESCRRRPNPIRLCRHLSCAHFGLTKALTSSRRLLWNPGLRIGQHMMPAGSGNEVSLRHPFHLISASCQSCIDSGSAGLCVCHYRAMNPGIEASL